MAITRDKAAPGKFNILIPAAAASWQPGKPQHLNSDILSWPRALTARESRWSAPSRFTTSTLRRMPMATRRCRTHHHRRHAVCRAARLRVRLPVRIGANGKIGAQNIFLVDKRSIIDPATDLNLSSGSH